MWRGPMGQARQNVPWLPPPIQRPCLTSRPATWLRTCLPQRTARKAHSPALRPAWRRSSGSTGYAPGSSKATNRSNMPWAGRTIRCAAIRRCDGTGNWCAAPSPFAGITSVIPLPVRRQRLPSHLREQFSQRQTVLLSRQGLGKKISEEKHRRLQVSWPMALRAVRAWLEPWIMLRRYWRAWSEQPPPGPLQGLLDSLGHGHQLFLYCTF